MKTWNRILMLFFLVVAGNATAQKYQEEVPGDNFSLQGALELFKKSASPEEFERLLNSSDAGVNNLDLNGDGDIDYIRVIDRHERNVHAFILQAVISERESQDVAVIALEKLANGKAVLQITGDADIYGIETIIEPTEEVRVNAGTSTAQSVVNVWTWPSVQYIYSPYYAGWYSPWSWYSRPYWWNPWRPVTYIAYYPRWESYYPYYSVCHTHRVRYVQHLYIPYRSTSVVVYNRHQTQITNYRSSRSADTRGREEGRDNNRNSSSDNSRSTSSYSQQENRRNSDWNQTSNNRRSYGTRDESAVRNRSNPNATRNPSGSWQSLREPREDSKNRSQMNTNSERSREFRTAPETHGSRTPQVERRESGSSGGQRSAPQLERRQSSGSSDTPQRSGNSGGRSDGNNGGKSGDTKRARN